MVISLPQKVRLQHRRFEIADIRHLRSIRQNGLGAVIHCLDDERPLSSKVEGADVLKELPKFSLGSYAHSSIRVREGQPILPKTDRCT